MTEHRIGTLEEWQAERDELLKEEKELTRRGDEVARKRRELPWVPVEKDYRFETEDGTKTLADLFDGRSQLLVLIGRTWAAKPSTTSRAPWNTLAPELSRLSCSRSVASANTPATSWMAAKTHSGSEKRSTRSSYR
jgi:predicted dithiol-disulfide oxidoreductase (DUF899 family)